MKVKGIVFAGTATSERTATTEFFTKIFGLQPEPLEGFPADVFSFEDGSSLGVVQVPDPVAATRTIGFWVEDLDEAVAELDRLGIAHDEIGSNRLGRYVHITAPDGRLYELVEKPGE